MPELSAPKSSNLNQSDVANDKLKNLQKAKADEERFIQELFLFLQKKHDLILEQQFFLLQNSLTAIAKDCGYQDLSSALNLSKNARGQTPLVQALQNQDFAFANALLRSGATFDDQAKAEYDIAIDSERGKQALQQHIITPPASYTPSDPDKLHIVKEYGLVLGIEMYSIDGTPSQRGHIGPTYKLMTNAVTEYSNACSKQPEKDDFRQISDAFTFSNKTANFQSSNPRGIPKAGEEICKRIQEGDVTSVPISCKGHAMGLSFAPVKGDPSKTYLIFTNRGEGAEPGQYGTRIYEVDKKNITPEFISTMMSGHFKGQTHEQIMDKIQSVTQGKEPVCSIEQKPQKYDNCSIANTRANIHGILLCQEANRKGGFEHVDKEEVRQRYKDFTSDMGRKKVQQLSKAIEKNPEDQDLRSSG